MSKQREIADQALAIILAKKAEDADYFPLDFTPEVQFRVDLDPPPVGKCRLYVQPVGFRSERDDRGDGRDRTYYVDLVFLESIPHNPMSAEGVEWLEKRLLFIEQLEDLDFSEVEAASWEDSEVVNLLFESSAVDEDAVFFQSVRLEFSE